MARDNSKEAVEKVLGTPIAAEYSEAAQRVRRNLLFASSISIAIVIGRIEVDPNSSIFGFKFIGLSANVIHAGLGLITGYLFLHFLWFALESTAEWRLRITGTRLTFITGAKFTSEHGDYPDDPRQSTLNAWWNNEAKRIGNIAKLTNAISDAFARSQDELKRLQKDPAHSANVSNATRSLAEITNSLSRLDNSINQVGKTLSSLRIPTSLDRFDKWFELLLRSQNLRWLLIETGTPLALGVWALWLLFC